MRVRTGVVVLLLGAAACGGGASDGQPDPSTTSTLIGDSDAEAPTTTTTTGTDTGPEAVSFDGCALLTQGDAESIFGGPAFRGEGDPAGAGLGVSTLGSCVWESDGADALSFQQLIFWVLDGAQFYGGSIYPNQQPLEIGERGLVSVDELLETVTIQFLLDGRTVTLSLSAFGNDAPDPAEAVSSLEQLAAKLAAGIP